MTEMTPATAPEASATPSTPAPAPQASPGQLLRAARERAGLGLEDLAGQLKLAKGTLEALERDDFAALSEPVYVRGYYRKIAKVLPIAEAELINAYNARTAPPPATPAMRRIPLAGGVAAGTSRQYRGQGLWIAGVVIVLAVLAFTLARREPPKRLAEAEPAPAPAAIAPVGATLVPPAAGPGSVATQPPAPAATVATPAATPAPAADAPPAVPNQLVLEFREASFVRVEDNRARTLAIGLVRGGERQALDGQPPYTVFLGNAQNVKVFFGGVPVDFSAHINAQNDTARFTVP